MQYGATQCLKSTLKNTFSNSAGVQVHTTEWRKTYIVATTCMYIHYSEIPYDIALFFLFLDYCVTTKYGNDGGGEVR